MKKPNETNLRNACVALLKVHGIFAFPNKTGAYPIGKRFIRYGYRGSSDILGLTPWDGKFLAIECKRATAVKPHQRDFLDEILKSRGRAYVVWNVGQLEEILKRIIPFGAGPPPK